MENKILNDIKKKMDDYVDKNVNTKKQKEFVLSFYETFINKKYEESSNMDTSLRYNYLIMCNNEFISLIKKVKESEEKVKQLKIKEYINFIKNTENKIRATSINSVYKLLYNKIASQDFNVQTEIFKDPNFNIEAFARQLEALCILLGYNNVETNNHEGSFFQDSVPENIKNAIRRVE